MNEGDRLRIRKHAEFILKEYRRFRELAGNNPWKLREARQLAYDALHSLKHHGLIEDYDLLTGEIK